MYEIGEVIHIGFGVMLLFCVVGLVVIGVMSPDLFDTIIEKLKDISSAVFPSITQSLA